MRRSIAFVIYVSLTAVEGTVCFAEPPETSSQAPEWATTHAAGRAAADRHSYEEAIQCFKQSWTLSRTATERAISANDLGQTYRQFGRPKDAIEWLERAYAVWKIATPVIHNLTVAASSLGDLYRDAGDYARAERLLREALEVEDRDAQHRDSQSADMIRNDLGDLLREEGRCAEAREIFLETLRNQEISWEQRLNALAGIADIDRQAGDWNASARAWNEVLELARSHGNELAEAVASRGLAAMWLDAGNPSRAEPLFRRAVAVAEENAGNNPEEVAIALSGMAGLYRAQNKLALAEGAWLRALQLERKVYGDTHPQVAWLKEMLADVYSVRGARDTARDYANQALEDMKSLFGENSLPAAVALANRGTVEQRAKEMDAAATDYARALTIAREHPGNDAVEKNMIGRYGVLLKAMHRNREARELSMIAPSFQ